jgi:hypothetical protein
MKDRAFMLRRLKAIRERRRPCLEPCLRFLLLGNEDEKGGRGPGPLDSDSSSEDEDTAPVSRKSRDFTVTLLRSHKNLAEPRTSQGTFAPNGKIKYSIYIEESHFNSITVKVTSYVSSEHPLESYETFFEIFLSPQPHPRARLNQYRGFFSLQHYCRMRCDVLGSQRPIVR